LGKLTDKTFIKCEGMMKKILVTILLMITALSANAFSAKLSVDAFKIMPGESKDIYISMDNADMPVIGIQVDIALPTGISLTDDPSLVAERIGSYTNKYGKTVASAKTISSNTVNGKLRLAILSLSDQAPFSGTSGDIIKRAIFKKHSSVAEAKTKLKAWYNDVGKCTLREVKSARDCIKSRQDHILNFFINRSTNAAAESLNSKMKGFRAQLHGIADIPFFMFRLSKIFG